jgi:hypothetical protein
LRKNRGINYIQPSRLLLWLIEIPRNWMNVRRCSFGPTRRNVDPHLPSLSLSPSQPSTLTKSNAQPNPSHLHGSPLALMTHAISLLRPHPDPAPPAGHPPAAVASSAFTARWCPSPTPPPPSSSGPGRERRRPPRDGGRHGHSRPCRIPTASSGRACLEMEGLDPPRRPQQPAMVPISSPCQWYLHFILLLLLPAEPLGLWLSVSVVCVALLHL